MRRMLWEASQGYKELFKFEWNLSQDGAFCLHRR